jgi:uracil-DNA glycosylase
MSALSKQEAIRALLWLLDAGADEAVSETPISRLGASRASLASSSTEPRPDRSLDKRGQLLSSQRAAGPAVAEAVSEGRDQTDMIGRALETAAQCTTLAELKAALERYEGSQLKKQALKTVFADGNPDSRILLVGEAPGREEDRSGLPFVGVAGKLLDLMLASIGLDRSSAYIINVLPWRPPENRTPEPTEVAQCIPFLRRHIELAQPEILILLGAVAVRHVLGLAEGIMKYRGRWMEYRVGQKMIPVMPTLHPAYLLRQPGHKKLAWRDLQAVEKKLLTLGLRES